MDIVPQEELAPILSERRREDGPLVSGKNKKLFRNLKFPCRHAEDADFRVGPGPELAAGLRAPPPDELFDIFVQHRIDLKMRIAATVSKKAIQGSSVAL
jgi:hypothetical protein